MICFRNLVFSLCFLAILAACQGEQARDEVNIGLIAEITGGIPAVGASCQNAAQLAVEQINADGGIDVGGIKKKAKLQVEDSGAKADQAVAVAQKLIAEGSVTAIVGPNTSVTAIPVSEIAESVKVPMISPWSTNPATTIDAKSGRNKRFAFRACFIDSFQGKVLAKFALDDLKVKSAAIFFDVASDYSKGIAEFFKKEFEQRGGIISAYETYTTKDRDFSAQLTKIKETSPDVIFLPNLYNDIPLQIQQAKRLGINSIILGSDSWGSSDLLRLCGADCEGYYFSTHYVPGASGEKTAQFAAAYKTRYQAEPDDVAALTYDSFGLLFQAINRAASIDPEKVRAALAQTSSYHGVTGTMHYKEGIGDPQKSVVIVIIRDGKFVYHSTVENQ